MKVIEKILMVVVELQERDYKIKYFDENDNGVYRIDIKRHEDDFWQSTEYKECERILGNSLIEGTYGSDTYTLWIKADEEYDCIGIGEIVRDYDNGEEVQKFVFTDLKDIVGLADSKQYNIGDKVKVYIKKCGNNYCK